MNALMVVSATYQNQTHVTRCTPKGQRRYESPTYATLKRIERLSQNPDVKTRAYLYTSDVTVFYHLTK
jgi:hypothetical protein